MTTEWQKEAYRCQKEWCQLLRTWKYFKKDDELIRTYIGIGLYGFTDTQSTTNLSLRTYYKNYSNVQQKSIEKIVNQLLTSNGQGFELGHTYLYLSENGVVCCIFRCRTKDKIIFIEPTGRAYSSWAHFLESNRLPSCKFIAPKNGVYSKTADILCYETPASKQWLNKSQSVMDWVCAVAGIGCTLLGVFSIAPGVVASTAIVVGVRNVHKSVANILDQNEHGQLAALNSVNGGISLANVALSALSGVSKSYEMISLVGEQSGIALKILQSLNITEKLIDAGCFGTYLLHLCYRIKKGNVSNLDALELAAQIFVLYGAVVDVQSLHQVITRQRVNTRADLGAKFNDWKRRLKRDIICVKDCDPLIALKLLASRNAKISFQIIREFYSKHEVILTTCFEIENYTLDYLNDGISLNVFCLELRQLVVNLRTLLDEDFYQIKHLLYRYTNSLNDQDARDVCKLLHYSISCVKEIEKSIPEKLPEKSLDSISSEETTRHRAIIETAKSLVKSNTYASTERVITSCCDTLLFTTTELINIITQTYNEMVEFNRSIVGEDRLQMILERIHAATVDEYFHHDRAFSNAINKFKHEKEFNSDESSHENPLSDVLVQEITDEVMALYDEAYSHITRSVQLSLQDTMTTLQNISLLLNEKLLQEMNSVRQQSTYSHMNAILEVTANESLHLSELEELAVLRQAKMRLQFEDIIPEFRPFAIEQNFNRTEKDDHQLYEALIMICSNFYNKISQMFEADESREVLRKVYYFIISKFANLMETCSKNQAARDALKTRDQDCKLIFAICSSSESLFYSVLEKFDDSKYLNDLTAEFLNWSYDDSWNYNKIAIWKDVIASNEFQLRFIRCQNNETDEYYKGVASKLFDINVKDTYKTIINVNSVFLISAKKFIVFNFLNDIVIVILLNLRLN